MPLLFCKHNEDMKYPQLVSSTTPASLQDWLEGELESRGIDGVYTRYILSLLQEDGTGFEPPECEHLFGEFGKSHWKQKESFHTLGKELAVPFSAKSKHYRLKSWEKERPCKSDIYRCNCMLLLDSEERKKSVAVECLKSASEQKIGIEKLIDEVCAKLKKIRSATGIEKDSIQQECNAKVLLSSPQEQAEKYYAAFPALCGKLEPLTQLCQQQESKRAIMTVWDKKKIRCLLDEVSSSKYISEGIDLASDEDFGSDCDSTIDKQSDISEKENDSDNTEREMQEPIDEEPLLKAQRNTTDYEPLFIVPKVKMSVHRIPFSVKCLPFNPQNIDQSKKVNSFSRKEILITEIDDFDAETDKLQLKVALSNVSSKDGTDCTIKNSSPTECRYSEREHNLSSSALELRKELSVLPYSTTLNISFSESFSDEDYAYNEFAGKFNNQLASIWTQNINFDQSEPSSKDLEVNFPLIFELSLKENYLKSPYFSLQFLEQSLNDIKSIWAASQDDFKLMSAKTSNLLPLTYFASNNSLVATKTENNSLKWEDVADDVQKNDIFLESFESTNEDDDDDTIAGREQSFPFLSVGFTGIEPAIEAGASLFSPWRAYHLSSETVSEKCGTYSLWTSPSSPLALERNEENCGAGFEQSLPQEYSNEHQYETDGHWCTNDCVHATFAKEMPLNKAKCTLTYHKGESLFVEVIPSPKPAREISKNSPYEKDIMEHDTLNPLSSDSDDLLTSPKTHFQPIHQDSLDMDNGEDDETMMLTLQADTPAEDCSFHNVVMLPECIESSLEEHRAKSRHISLEADECTGSKSIYKNQTIHTDSSYDLLNFSKDAIQNKEKIYPEQIDNLDLSGFPEVWNNDYYKEKATNTETPSCSLLDCMTNYEDVNDMIDSNRKFGLLDGSEDDIVLSVNHFLSSKDISNSIDKWKWSTNENNECWNVNEDTTERWESPNNQNGFICSKHTEKLDIRNNLEALKKEIEEEEDELFRDITRLNDGTCDSDLDSPETIFSTYYDYENKCFSGAKQWSTETEIAEYPFDMYDCMKPEICCWDSTLSEDYNDQYKGHFRLGSSDLEGRSLFPSVPADKVLYSSDLEDEWRRSSHSFNNPHCRKTKYRHRIAPQRKPCSFYLEGSCRRSDCKFSHDLANITCRFWEEGSCFKGVTCPFLHGYSGSDGFRHDCRHRKSNYVLESEADFPSLSTSVPQDFEKESPRDIPGKGSRRKKRRGKTQHGLIISSSWPQQKGNKH